MGMAMLAGIVGIFEIANTINNNNSYSQIPTNRYSGSIERTADSLFLKALSKADVTWDEGNAFCLKLKEEAISMGYSSVASDYYIYDTTPTLNLRLKKPCVLMKGNHRILVSTDISNRNLYNYYSCILDNQAYCKFENDYNQ